MIYKKRPCKHCKKSFQPTSSRNFYCSIGCNLWHHVDVRSEDECWNWNLGLSPKGYAYVANQRAHRVSYEVTHGAIPKGLMVCHKCDNRKCVNPRHLFLGSARDNMDDMIKKGRQRHPAGEKNGSKITEKEALAILESKLSSRKTGAIYKVNHKTVLGIWSGKYWGYLKHPRQFQSGANH